MKKKFKQSRLGCALRVARKEQGMTQAELGVRASVTMPTIRMLENGRGNLSSWFACLSAMSLRLVGRQLAQDTHIGIQIATLRKRRHISQRHFANTISISQPTLIGLERHSTGRLDVLERALHTLGVSAHLVDYEQSTSFYTHAGNSSSHHGWHTPSSVLTPLYKIFGRFDLDPCSPTADQRRAPVKAKTHFTLNDDGLSVDWFGTVFVNPPYGRQLPLWTQKAQTEVAKGNAQTVIEVVRQNWTAC